MEFRRAGNPVTEAGSVDTEGGEVLAEAVRARAGRQHQPASVQHGLTSGRREMTDPDLVGKPEVRPHL